MTIREQIIKTRTVRRFAGNKPVPPELLVRLVDLARLGGSARNAQVLKYMIIWKENLCQEIFPLLGWAGYLTDWPGPAPEERPPAYVVCLLDTELLRGPVHEAHFDLGIASQNMLLGASELGLAGCRIASFSPRIHEILCCPPHLSVLLVIALGYPAEKVVLENVGPDGDIRYWRDDDSIHHVPKRALQDILLPCEKG